MLVLAWALGDVVKDVQTAEYLAGALESGVAPYMLPALISVRGKGSNMFHGLPELLSLRGDCIITTR